MGEIAPAAAAPPPRISLKSGSKRRLSFCSGDKVPFAALLPSNRLDPGAFNRSRSFGVSTGLSDTTIGFFSGASASIKFAVVSSLKVTIFRQYELKVPL